VITLTLLHPLQSIPVQSWTFERESVIRIGRSTDNHVILYSAVVSRHHVELRCINGSWEVVNLGANGTYLDGKRITQVPLVDGATIRLARSGPNIQIHIGDAVAKSVSRKLSGEETVSQQVRAKVPEHPTTGEPGSADEGVIPVPPHLQLPVEPPSDPPSSNPFPPQPIITNVDAESDYSSEILIEPEAEEGATQCLHPRVSKNMLFCLDCGQPLQVVQTIGAYKVMKTLGQGGMGVTYLAWHSGQTVVLKTLNPEWVNHSKARQLFEREAKILRQLNHPGIPRFIDFFVVAEQPYLAMEMVYGQNLGQWVATYGAISQAQAISWTAQVCDVLSYLHRQTPPLLHRDIKPENLIYRTVPKEQHEIAVVDFGAVKILAREAGTQIGSAGYTAPEQQEGQATPASDLYAIGATLVYLLTGQEPSSFYAHREQGFRLYAEYVPGLTSEMISVIRTLTNPKPEERYGSADELANVLRSLL
jgi:eukaryotic-like serine/threonine-protein kinase